MNYMKELVLILLGLLSIAGCNSNRLVVLSEIPFVDKLNGRNIVVIPVEINSSTYHFLVDTGTAVTVFDKKIAHQLGSYIETVDNDNNPKKIRIEEKLFYGPDEFKIGKIKVAGDHVFPCFDLLLLCEKDTLDLGIDGIIGVDILSKEFIVQFDFDHKIMRIMRYPKDKAHDLKAERNGWGDSAPLITDEFCRPYIQVNLTDSIKELFLIDTGATADVHLLNKDKMLSIRNKANKIVYAESNNQEALVFHDVRIGEAVFSEMLFAEPPKTYSVSTITTYLFGELKMFTLDFAQKKVYFARKQQ